MPNTVIQLKKSATVSAKPSDLANGELAINFADGKLFYKNTSGFIAEFSSGVNSFGTVNANGTLVVSDTSGDILTLLAGEGINIVGDAVNDRITFTATGNAVASFNAANLSNSIAIAAFAKANAALPNTTGTFAGTLTVANNLIVTGNVGIGNTSPSPAKLFVDGTTRFAGDGAGANWLEFLRAGSNNWRLDSSGVGTVMTIAGNLVTFPQNVLIQREGLTVTPTTTTSSSLIVNHSATTNNSININLTPTWNGSGNTFTGYGINVTNIACNTVTSGFFHARANGNSAFRVDLAGNIYVREGFGDYQGYKITNAYDSTAFGGITNSFRQFTFSSAITFGMSNIDTQSRSDAALGWSRDTNSQGTMDIAFYKDAANTIGIRGGSLASGKGLRLYGNYTDASNYERINITANSSGHYIIGEEGGTGSARPLYLGANNATAVTIAEDRSVAISTTLKANTITTNGDFYLKLAQGIGIQHGGFWASGSAGSLGAVNGAGFAIAANYDFGWTGTNYDPVAAVDLKLVRDAGDILAQRRGTANQTYRLYGTYTDASNYERIAITANTSGHYIIGEEGGTGSARPLYLGANNATAVTINTNGRVGIGISTAATSLDIQGGYAEGLRIRGPIVDNNWYGGIQLTNSTGAASGAVLSASTLGLFFSYDNVERMRITAAGNIGIGTTSPAYKLEVAGSFAAQTKSFIINHQSKPDHKLRHGSLEGPENGVYVRGKSTSNIIELPDYWTWLVDEDTITVNITPIGKNQNLFVEKVENNKVYIKNNDWFTSDVNYFYTVYGERNDVDKLIAEIPNP